jgi:hypothetical protein
MIRNAVVVTLACLAVTACSRQWQKTESFDAFEKTEYWQASRLDWEGGTSISKTTVCVKDGGLCVEGKYVHVNETGGRALVIVNTDDYRVYVFDRYTGQPIDCLNCASREHYENVVANTLSWFGNGRHAVATDGSWLPGTTSWRTENDGVFHIWLLEVLPEGIRVSQVSPRGDAYSHGRPLRISVEPDGSAIAWHLCDPRCALWQYNLTDATYLSTATPCDFSSYNSYWEISWAAGIALSEHYWSTRPQEMCLNQDGSPAFPVQQ